MEPVYTPHSEWDLWQLVALFEAEGIPYYIRNQHVGALCPGPVQLDGVNARTLMVPVDHLDLARALVEAHRLAAGAFCA